MTPPEFTRITSTGQRHSSTSRAIWWNANIENGERILILPRPSGYQIAIFRPGGAGESYGMYSTLEAAYLEACVIHAEILAG